MSFKLTIWYSAGPVCTESGVESFGGVGGKGNKCCEPCELCICPTLSCGSGHANGLLHELPGAKVFGSDIAQCRGVWKCGLHTWGDECDVGILEAENKKMNLNKYGYYIRFFCYL